MSVPAAHLDDSATREDRRAALLAAAVAGHLVGTDAGHCVRVNYLDRQEAEAVCAHLRELPTVGTDLDAFVLVSADDSAGDPLDITADRAIEQRNRKRGRLCLFVPSDLVDAAISSLGNSFAELDGRGLYRQALTRVTDELGPVARGLVQQVRADVTTGTRTGDGDLLDLALDADERARTGRIEELGLELWRVGLIADGRPDFDLHLTANRRHARLLARPARLDAPARDRVASLKAAPETARALEHFFARRPMHDVRSWSRDLIAEGLTYDRWIFPETVQTDLQSVQVKPSLDAHGALLKTAARSFLQPDGAGSPLFAPVGEKAAISVGWTTDPLKPNNIQAWSVSLVPARTPDLDGEGDDLPDLPAKEVKGTLRTTRLRLDLDLDEAPEVPFAVRVAAMDETGNEVLGPDGDPIASLGNEFYLTLGGRPKAGVTERRRTVPSLAEGRLRAAVEARTEAIELTQPSWSEGKGVAYFSVRVDDRNLLTVALSPLLLELEKRTLRDPRAGGRWALSVDEVHPAAIDAVAAAPAIAEDTGEWEEFWRARAAFFGRLRRGEARDVVEAADWTPEVINAALRYGTAYGALLHATPAGRSNELRAALTVDTLLLKFDVGDKPDEAVVVLPTHPLRVAWFASHAALLRHWEEAILRRPRTERARLVDRDLVRDLRPVNMPAFAFSWRDGWPYVFFQNLAFSHGVALPAHAPDPVRRYLDIARVLGLGDEPQDADDRGPERLGSHVKRFLEIHPYADPLQLALVNPDGGEFLADALEQALGGTSPTDEDAEPPATPAVDVTAYVLEERQGGLSGLDRLRTRQHERRTRLPSDHLRPALASTVRPYDRIAEGDLEHHPRYHAHVAVVSDMSQPKIVAAKIDDAEGAPRSLSLYGLIARFVGEFAADDRAISWRYRIAASASGRLDGHPAGPRFGEALVELQAAILDAAGRYLDLSGEAGREPVLEVRLDEDRRDVLERLHEGADWVVTVDRFFGVDYYDSPNHPALATYARKHLIDYSPEFVEGLGHRMIVTTAWREEVSAILRRAMEDLGFAAVDRSVGQLLHYLKTVSGRLALQALSPTTGGAAAVSLGAVMAWLQGRRRLANAVLVPVDVHPDVFAPTGRGPIAEGQRRCDLVLVGTRRGIVDMTFVEVKWRRGPLTGLDDLVDEMRSQMAATAETVRARFFDPDRVDGPLQRACLANVLRFYAGRARRYGLLDDTAAATLLNHLVQYEKAGADFRPRYEGFVVSLESEERRPVVDDLLTVTILTARDFQADPDFGAALPPPSSPPADAGATSADDKRGEPTDARASAVTPQDEPERGPTPVNEPAETDAPSTSAEPRESATSANEAPRDETLVETEPTPQAPSSPVEVVLGDGVDGEIVWTPSIKGSPHLFVTGIPGQGKSWTLLRLLTELGRQGVPALVFDYHGQFGAAGNPYLVTAAPVVVDAASGLPFSPFECSLEPGPADWEATALAVSEIFAYVCGLGDIQRDALFTCIRDAYRSYGFGREREQPEEFPSLHDVMRSVEQAERRGSTRNLVARCRPLLELDIFRPPAGTQNALLGALRQGLVVGFDRLRSEMLQQAAGAFLLRKLYRDMFAWGTADRLRLVVVLDEAHRLARDVTLPLIMKEGRKFGIAVVVASQGLADFHPDVVGNAGTKVAFRANFPDSRKVAGFFRARQGQDLTARLEGLSVGQALIQTPEMGSAVVTRMRPPAD